MPCNVSVLKCRALGLDATLVLGDVACSSVADLQQRVRAQLPAHAGGFSMLNKDNEDDEGNPLPLCDDDLVDGAELRLKLERRSARTPQLNFYHVSRVLLDEALVALKRLYKTKWDAKYGAMPGCTFAELEATSNLRALFAGVTAPPDELELVDHGLRATGGGQSAASVKIETDSHAFITGGLVAVGDTLRFHYLDGHDDYEVKSVGPPKSIVAPPGGKGKPQYLDLDDPSIAETGCGSCDKLPDNLCWRHQRCHVWRCELKAAALGGDQGIVRVSRRRPAAPDELALEAANLQHSTGDDPSVLITLTNLAQGNVVPSMRS